MNFDQVNQMKSLGIEQGFLLSYSGFVSEDILEAVGRTLRERLQDMDSSPKQIRQVFSIFVELMQNVIRYGGDGPQPQSRDGEKPSYGMLSIAKDDDNLIVMSGNFIANNRAKHISMRIDELKTKSKDELRQIYKEKLRQPSESTSKGASLGLIEIARRSSTPPDYIMTDGPSGTSFLIIKASVQH